MSEISGQANIGRSILAVFAGFVVVVFLSIGTDMILHLAGTFPKLGQPMANSLFVWATIYRTIYDVVGSYVTARLAPARPMMHSLIGGAIGLVIATIGAVATWNRGPEFGPHWYPVSLIIGTLPTAWIGAQICIRQTSSR